MAPPATAGSAPGDGSTLAEVAQVDHLIRSPKTGSFLSRVFRANLSWLGGAENDEGIEIFGRSKGVYFEAGS
jgi:hypothetical protein